MAIDVAREVGLGDMSDSMSHHISKLETLVVKNHLAEQVPVY